MNTIYRLPIVVLLFVTIVSCSTTSIPSPVASQTSKPASNVSGLENVSTFTAHPSFTPLPNVTLTQTQIVLTQDATATQYATQTEVAQSPDICIDSYAYPRYSPNGLWLEELCYSDVDRGLVLALSNSESQVLWKFLYQDHIPQMDFVPVGGMEVTHWSSDGRYAYFFSHLGGDGGECFYIDDDRGAGLFRVDLQTGQSTTILPLNDDFWWYGFSISPTDRRLVYGAQARNLKILDIKTGELINIKSQSNNDETGGFLWSDDGLRLVYTALTQDSNGETKVFSVHLVDALSGNERILLETSDSCLVAVSWKDENVLKIKKNFGEAVIEFDLKTNTIINETAAP